MKIETKVNDRRLQLAISKEMRNRPGQLKRSLLVTAEWLRGRIVDRTQKGQGLKGAFVKYTRAYREFRRANGLGVKPDLTFSGNMTSNMATRGTPSYSEIFFPATREAKKAIGKKKKRPFFGFTGREGKTMIRIFAEEFKRNSKL